MLKNIKDSSLIYEEKRTLKWFLICFLSISIIYDGIYYFISPIYCILREQLDFLQVLDIFSTIVMFTLVFRQSIFIIKIEPFK